MAMTISARLACRLPIPLTTGRRRSLITEEWPLRCLRYIAAAMSILRWLLSLLEARATAASSS